MEASRAMYRGQVTRLANSAMEYLSTTKKEEDPESLDSIEEELTVAFQRLSAAHESLNKVNSELRASMNIKEDAAKEWEKVAAYEDLAIGVLSRLQLRLEKIKGKRSNIPKSSSATGENQYRATKLPKLPLTRFSGYLKDWIPFWEQFKTAIHENDSLSGAEKFNYLRSVLTGKAEKSIAGFTPSASCYDGAIALLQEEYGNTEKLIDDNMQELMALQPIYQKSDVSKLRNLYNTVMTCVRSLTALGVATSNYYIMLKTILLKCLPNDLRIEYHRQQSTREKTLNTSQGDPTEVNLQAEAASEITSTSILAFEGDNSVSNILKFIKREVESLEKASVDREKQSHTSKRFSTASTAAAMTVAAKEICIFCKSSKHAAIVCDSIDMTLDQRKEILRNDGRCFRCLKQGHMSKFCRVKGVKCVKCKGKHPFALCDPSFRAQCEAQASLVKTQAKGASHDRSKEGNVSEMAPALSLCAQNKPFRCNTIFLQTARVIASDVGTLRRILVRVIIDSGSHYSYISEAAVKKLGLSVIGTQRLNLLTFGSDGQSTGTKYKQVRLKLKSQFNNSFIILDALVVPRICADVLAAPNKNKFQLQEFQLADSLQINDGIEIEDGLSILIGADTYWSVVTDKLHRITSKLTAVETIFGWTLHGPADDVTFASMKVTGTCLTLSAIVTDNEISKLWNLDVLGISNEVDCVKDQELFEKCITRSKDRYEASLPWKNQNVILDDNRNGALKRFRNLVRKLARDSKRFIDYDMEMAKLIDAGFAERVNDIYTGKRMYYLPHRPVYREDKTTTKLRIVFDASAHGPNATSLNDNLYVGENLLPDVLKVILNFRAARIGLVSDIEKAFLQILLKEDDRDVHRFFWYANSINSLQDLPSLAVFRLTRVTFGVTSSPFHLTATIRRHLSVEASRYPETCEVMQNAFYMDDLVFWSDNEAEAEKLYSEAKTIMQSASMRLYKWNSNHPKLRALFVAHGEKCPVVQKVLGVVWNTVNDDLTVNLDPVIQFIRNEIVYTKRGVLQVVSRIFDPIGMLSPVTVKLKILFQDLWKYKLSWDELLDKETNVKFSECCNDLLNLSDFFLPRSVLSDQDLSTMQLHIFADASLRAYGAVAYVKSINKSGKPVVYFLCSKNRVAPLKEDGSSGELTLPRLELTAALVASRLLSYIRKSLKLKFQGTYLWTDSQIVLHWIRGRADQWKPYVRNRVEEIQRLTSTEYWKHCPGKCNPADLLTRGKSAEVLVESALWKHGPDWLREDIDNDYPMEEGLPAEAMVLAMLNQSTPSSTITIKEPVIPPSRYSSWRHLLRVTAWILRFSKGKNRPATSFLTAQEINQAKGYWIKFVQNSYFQEAYSTIVPSGNQLISRAGGC